MTSSLECEPVSYLDPEQGSPRSQYQKFVEALRAFDDASSVEVPSVGKLNYYQLDLPVLPELALKLRESMEQLPTAVFSVLVRFEKLMELDRFKWRVHRLNYDGKPRWVVDTCKGMVLLPAHVSFYSV